MTTAIGINPTNSSRITEGGDRVWENSEVGMTVFYEMLAKLNAVADLIKNIPASNAPAIDKTIIEDMLLKALNAELSLPEAFYQQAFDRMRERTNATAQAAIDDTNRQLSAAGWSQPIGASVERIDRITQAAMLENSENAREVFRQKVANDYDYTKQMLSYWVQFALADANFSLETMRLDLATLQTNIGYLKDIAASGASVTAQHIASLFSMLNYNSSMSSSASISASSSISNSRNADDGMVYFVPNL